MSRPSGRPGGGALAGLQALLAAASALVLLTGCVGAPNPPSAASNTTTGPVTTVIAVQTCAECAGKPVGSPIVGSVDETKGVQVVEVGLESGYYVPNTFDVKAGVPVIVSYAGKAAGCLARPTFKSLGLKADLTNTTAASVRLGALKPGTYRWTCGMGSPGGVIVAR